MEKSILRRESMRVQWRWNKNLKFKEFFLLIFSHSRRVEIMEMLVP